MSTTTTLMLIIAAYVLGAVAFGSGAAYLIHDGHPWWGLAFFCAAGIFANYSARVTVKPATDGES